MVQSIPRSIVFDQKTGKNIVQWPVEEVESLRSTSVEFKDVNLVPGSIIPLKDVHSPSQVSRCLFDHACIFNISFPASNYNIIYIMQADIIVSFDIDKKIVEETSDMMSYDCPKSGGAVNRGVLGPFGIIVLADQTLSELTPIYFYLTKGYNGKLQTHFCADELRLLLLFAYSMLLYN